MPQYLVGPTRPYTTIQAAINAVPSNMSSPALGVHEIIVDAGTYTEHVDTGSRSADASNYMLIRAADGAEHKGISGAGVVVTPPGSTQNQVLNLRAGFTVIRNIEFTAGSVNITTVNLEAAECILENLIIRSPTGWPGINVNNSVSACKLRKLLIHGGNPSFPFAAIIFQSVPGASVNEIENCGIYNYGGPCIWNNSGTIRAKVINTWVFRGGSGGNSCFLGSFHADSSNNAANDSTAPGANSLNSLSLVQYGFVAAGSNFHITASSSLFSAGRNLSSNFTQDIDLETIGTWCIGPDCFVSDTPEPYKPTGSTPYKGRSLSHKKQRDAQDRPGKTQGPTSSQGLKKGGKVQDASAVGYNNKKGQKTGFLSIIPEGVGYGGQLVLGTGNKIPFVSDTLNSNKVFSEQYHVGKQRAESTRKGFPVEPGGAYITPLRSNDCIPLLMSHFHNRIGTTPAVGTTFYEFTPLRSIRTGGPGFGTGSYGGDTAAAFTVSAYKVIEGTGYHFKSGLCSELSLAGNASGEALISPKLLFSQVDIVGTSTMSNLGEFSTKDAYHSWNVSIDFLGLQVTAFNITSSNNLKRTTPSGTDSRWYKFTRHTVNGQVAVDVPKTALAYLGSMLSGESFPVYGTFYNSETDKIVFQMPNCRLDDFAWRNTTQQVIPFKAYESEDGATPALKLQLWTTGYSATTFQPN